MAGDIRLKYLTRDFLKSEFRCRCGEKDCDAEAMKGSFLAKLQALRDAWGKAMIITSGARCVRYNERVGGVAGSQHIEGRAADIAVRSIGEAQRLGQLAEKHGFGGIGIGRAFVHVDDGAPGRRWTYK